MRRQGEGLCPSLEHGLNSYALAASAAGVSLLALAQPANAKVVYTRTHKVIGWNGIYSLDLNHDGTVDFLIQQWGQGSSSGSGFSNALLAKEALGNAVEGSIVWHGSQPSHSASALKQNARIGPGQGFISGGYNGERMVFVWSADGGGGTYGRWINVNNRYLGLKFKINGKIHYGWARLSVQLHQPYVTATLTGYAYETVPQKGIRAGQTKDEADDSKASPDSVNSDASGLLGALARGAQGVPLRRRP